MERNGREMNKYFQVQKSAEITLCDCMVDEIHGNFDEIVFHLPQGVVSCEQDDAHGGKQAVDVHFVGCASDSVLCYMVRPWRIFGKRLKVASIIELARIMRRLNVGFKIWISEEYCAYKKMYFKATVVNKAGRLTSKEVIIRLDDIERVKFVND